MTSHKHRGVSYRRQLDSLFKFIYNNDNDNYDDDDDDDDDDDNDNDYDANDNNQLVTGRFPTTKSQ